MSKINNVNVNTCHVIFCKCIGNISARALKVAPSAGVTKSVHMKVKICEKPNIFLFDTPGILTPRVSDPTSALKLAACG